MNIVAVIPAREVSKRLKGKNKKLFLGKPLICWTIDLALENIMIDKVIVSTDDKDILDICLKKYNDVPKPFTILKRSKELAEADTPIWKVLQDIYIRGYLNKNSVVLLLQPTSPLRTSLDIRVSLLIFSYRDVGIVSIYKKDELTYIRNGAIYIDYYHNWMDSKHIYRQFYLMPENRSVDIDTIEDWNLAIELMKRRLPKKDDYDLWYHTHIIPLKKD